MLKGSRRLNVLPNYIREENIPTMVWSRQEMICGAFRDSGGSVIAIKCYSETRDVDCGILVWFMFLANFCE